MHFKLLLPAWVRLLRENGRYIAPGKLGHAAAITAASACHSLLDLIQNAAYRDALARVRFSAPPVFIIGPWRSGTTLLHELLCMDEGHAFASTHACMNPSHFLMTERFIKDSPAGKTPVKRPMDNMAISLASPQEDEFALFALGAPSPYVHWMFPANLRAHPEYFDLNGVKPEELQRWKSIFTKFLKQVALRNPGRLVIKSPPHTFRVKLLLEMFPDASFIHIVRDPYVLFASTRHMLARMFGLYALTAYRADDLEEYILGNGVRMEKALDAALPALRRDRYHRIRYEDLIASPVEQMTALYEKLALGDIGKVLPAVRTYFERHADYQANRFDLSRDEESRITNRWRDMILKYGYPLRRA